MEIINQLRSLTNQLNENEKFLDINQQNYSKSEQTLKEYFQAALLDLKAQIQKALEEERLWEMKLTVSDERLTQILSANTKKKEYEEQRERIISIMSDLNTQRYQLLKENFDILEDFGGSFWRVCVDPTASFIFETSNLKIKNTEGEFEIPYRRFTEPKEIITAEIAVDVQKRKLSEQILYHEKEIAGLKMKRAELKGTESIERNDLPKTQSLE
jgi:hypothetical protein